MIMNHKGSIITLCSAVLIGALASCSSPKTEEPSGLPASRICDSAFDSAASNVLTRLSKKARYEELPDKADWFTPDRAVKSLHKSASERTDCLVYAVGDESGTPLLDISFEGVNRYPKAEDQSGGSSRDQADFVMGEFATASEIGATLIFSCHTSGEEGRFRFIKAGMYSTLRSSNGELARDLMTILNSISRKVAHAADCADSAELPSSPPEPRYRT
ncbi:hypothetical protein ACIBI4_29425 [Streptomyces sp. NPDC050418]|uniref:hypothetical protein n=1 Tax=Streptomyces sp. NPDC050418 TaxID=3365612 RepID=UPI0037A30A7F